jgi:hypothetical protein
LRGREAAVAIQNFTAANGTGNHKQNPYTNRAGPNVTPSLPIFENLE